jgi:hypothetical protein
MATLVFLGTLAFTAALIGIFLLISQYFRSDRVREFVEQTDKLLE